MTLAISIPAHEPTDGELLARFAASPPDQAAFEDLVHRHIHWIYAAALRITRDAALAEDVTQGVLWALAKKARTLSHRKYIGGWLFEATRYTATTLLRSERRRKERERMIAQRNSAPQETLNWENLQPRLDAAIARLPAADRNLIVLRYLQRKSHEEIGAALGTTEEAARKRVNRALGKLRLILGAAATTASLGATLASGPAVAAPSHLITAVLTGKISAKAALLAKGVALMHKALVLKFAFAAAVLTVCTGYLVESFAAAQGTPAPTANVAATPAPAPADATPTPPTAPSSLTITSDGVTFLMSPAAQGGGGGTARVVSSSVSTDGTTLTRHVTNAQYDITLQTTGNATTTHIKDANGIDLYNGPLMTDADRAKVPADALPLIDGATRQGVLTIANPVPFGMARQQFSLDAIKQQLGATDEQWTDLQDRVRLVMTLQRYLAAGSAAPGMAGRGPSGIAPNADGDNPIAAPVRDLTAALADKDTKPEDLEAKVDAVRSARQQVEDSLAKNRQKLEAAVTARQKAVLVNLQILD